jgi:A/G-specific adenine glycosylase
MRDVHWRVHLHVDAQRGLWLTRRPVAGIWAGLWTPPITELSVAPDASPAHIHLLTHRRLHLYAEMANHPPSGDGQWIADLNQVALPTGIRRLLAKHGSGS